MSIMCYLSSWCYHCLRARRFFDFVSCFFAIKQMDDQTHLKAFNHSFPELNTKRFDLKQAQPQEFDFFLVLDLEGKVEILEFPVLMIDAKTLKLVDFFHRLFIPVDNFFFRFARDQFNYLGLYFCKSNFITRLTCNYKQMFTNAYNHFL